MALEKHVAETAGKNQNQNLEPNVSKLERRRATEETQMHVTCQTWSAGEAGGEGEGEDEGSTTAQEEEAGPSQPVV